MAQPPESSQLRLQSSLDSSPVEPCREPTNIDTLAPDKQQHQHGQNQHKEDHHRQHRHHDPLEHQHQQQQQQQLSHPQSLPRTEQTSPAPQQPHNGDVPTSTTTATTCTYSVENGSRHALGGSDEKETPNDSSTVKFSPQSYASAGSIVAAEKSMQEVRGGLYETRYNGDAPLMSTSAMSNTHPSSGPQRQSMGYGGPMSYPSAGLAPASHYPYTQAVPAPHTDHYRPTPTALPSMRTLDHGHGHGHGHGQPQPQAQPQPQPQQSHGLPMGAHMGAPMGPGPGPTPMGYYGVHQHVYGLPDPNALRFALPQGLAADPRIAMSGGRHKKVPVQSNRPLNTPG